SLAAGVDVDAAFVPVDGEEDRVVRPSRVRYCRADEVTRGGPLDLDHVGAVVGQHFRRAGAHVDLGEVEYTHTVKRTGHRVVTSSPSNVALSDGRSPGSAPCSRIRIWISAAGTSRTRIDFSTATAAAIPRSE